MEKNLKDEIKFIILNVCSFEILPTMMMIQKGRSLIFDIMKFCATEDMFKIFKSLIKSLHKYGRKIPEESVNNTYNFFCKPKLRIRFYMVLKN